MPFYGKGRRDVAVQQPLAVNAFPYCAVVPALHDFAAHVLHLECAHFVRQITARLDFGGVERDRRHSRTQEPLPELLNGRPAFCGLLILIEVQGVRLSATQSSQRRP